MSKPNDEPRQLGLFGAVDPPATPAGEPARIAAAPHNSSLRELAARLPEQLRFGTSSWNFAGWRGLVYGDQAPIKRLSRDGLAAYAQHPLLRTVGVDRTFYAPIPADTFRGYADQVPGDFRFLVKAWGELLEPKRRGQNRPNPRYFDAETLMRECIEPARQGLGDRLGVVLLQLPPQGPETTRDPVGFAKHLAALLAQIPEDVPLAIELRDGELLTEAYRDVVHSSGRQHGYVVHPRMPRLPAQHQLMGRATSPPAPLVVRWMLHAGFGYEQAKERYQPFDRLVDGDVETRRELAQLCCDAALRSVPMTVVVNNKAEGSAPHSIVELARAVVFEAAKTAPNPANTAR
ncbi:MAG: DUF72 domain-containing protein [Planctomycetota bacterium]